MLMKWRWGEKAASWAHSKECWLQSQARQWTLKKHLSSDYTWSTAAYVSPVGFKLHQALRHQLIRHLVMMTWGGSGTNAQRPEAKVQICEDIWWSQTPRKSWKWKMKIAISTGEVALTIGKERGMTFHKINGRRIIWLKKYLPLIKIS